MKCQKCGAELLSGSRFCSECGTEQPKSSAENELISEYGVKICKNCNAQIPADSRFCPECSAKQFKHITCPCCSKEVNIPLGKFSTGFDFNYSILINSQTEFFDLVDICPECGLAMLFDNGVSDEMREYIKSAEYRNILNNNEIEYGLKKWILLAMVSEKDENYTREFDS